MVAIELIDKRLTSCVQTQSLHLTFELNILFCQGFVDVVDMVAIEWNNGKDSGDGRDVQRTSLTTANMPPAVVAAAVAAREKLCEKVAELDDEFCDIFLGRFNHACRFCQSCLAFAIKHSLLIPSS
jgi:hypothetical protein